MKQIRRFGKSIAVLALIIGLSQANSTVKASEPDVQAYGCRFTGNDRDFCIWYNFAVLNCCNSIGGNDCGFDLPPTQP